MPHEQSANEDVKLWIEYANADLAIAKAPLPPGAKYELLLFHAQQAVEKAIKSVLIKYGIEFPRTHNIPRLIELLPAQFSQLPLLLNATPLTEYAVVARYPGEAAPVDEARYNRLVEIAEAVVRWAEQVVSQ